MTAEVVSATASAAALAEASLRITEIFTSLQGEARSAGHRTTFVRLTGCPLRCHYCDTAYAFSGGQLLPVAQILSTVAAAAAQHVCVTGGEPLAQPGVLKLLTALCDAGYAVSLETSGALDVAAVDVRVSKVLDLKTPDSGESHRNLWPNLAHCGPHDQAKFVICSRADYDWARLQVDQHGLAARFGDVWFSPSTGVLAPGVLADWMLADRVAARLQIQLHKVLWGDEPGR